MECICRRCVAFCQPGNTLRELHHLSIQLLSEGLADLGVCGRMGPASIAQNAYSTFYPHSVGKLDSLVHLTCSKVGCWILSSRAILPSAVDRATATSIASIDGMYKGTLHRIDTCNLVYMQPPGSRIKISGVGHTRSILVVHLAIVQFHTL